MLGISPTQRNRLRCNDRGESAGQGSCEASAPRYDDPPYSTRLRHRWLRPQNTRDKLRRPRCGP
jgi:hypothetical protein